VSDNHGGIYNTGISVIIGNSVSNNSDRGIYNEGSSTVINDNSIIGNVTTGNSGAGIYNKGDSITITNNTITGNTANSSDSCEWCLIAGGGIFNSGSYSIIENNIISGNSAVARDYNNIMYSGGGGVYNNGYSVTIENNIITNNICSNHWAYVYGSGIYSRSNYITIENNQIENNSSEQLHVYDNFPKIINNVITKGSDGIVIWMDSEGSKAEISNNSILNNSNYGISYVRGYLGSCTINNNTIANNYIGIYSEIACLLENNSIFNNTIGIKNSSDSTIKNNSITNNSDYGIYNTGNSLIVSNILEYNGSSSGSGICNYGLSSIEGNKITNNLGYGLRTTFLSSFTTNDIYANKTYDCYYTGTTDQTATNNYWGTTNTSQIDNSIYDYWDEITLGKVIYIPVASQPFIQPNIYFISGTVKLNGVGLGGVEVTLSGNSSSNTTTDSLGNYCFTGLSSGMYTITPSKSGYIFTPTSSLVIISGANQIGINFTANMTHSISGTVTLHGSGLGNVTVTLSGSSSESTTTDASGNYTFTGLNDDIYTVTPSNCVYTFTPSSRTVVISGANINGMDFVASLISSSNTLPKTGQTKCYDTSGNELSCKGTGQDGDIQAGVAWPEPRFTDNGDDTITDNLTGLMWTKNANLLGGYKTWQQALDYVKGMNAGTYPNYGFTDWRLPNVNELESLINANETYTATWLTTQGFTNVQARDYWSSTTYAYGTDGAWFFGMSGGDVYHDDKSSSSYYVWPVRGGQCGSFVDSVICPPQTGQTKCYDASGTEISCAGTGQDGEIQAGVAWPEPRFTDNGDGTVTDNLTGLMWTKDANLPGGLETWQQALDYVKSMNAGTYTNHGYTDWYLPNRKELHSLTDYSRYKPAFPSGHPFTNVQADGYWSSTTYAGYLDNAWFIDMWAGRVGINGKSYVNYYVWPVRSGQIGPLGGLDISVIMADSPDPMTVGSNLTYTITVTNNGPETATGVVLTDILPSNVTYVSASSIQASYTKSGNTITCNICTLSNGASATVTIVVTPTTVGTITNTATVTCNETDTNSANNTATATTTVNEATGCSTWSDVIGKYNSYVSGQATWTDVINCYNEYVS